MGKIVNLFIAFSLLILFSQDSWGFLLLQNQNELYLAANKSSNQEIAQPVLDTFPKDPPEQSIEPSVKLMDGFEFSSDAISTWWDIDGAKVYKRELVQDIKRSGNKSMKVYFKKTDPNLSWSFFAFQPQQDGKNNDFSKYSKLVFWLYVPETLEEGVPLELMVKLEDKNGKGYEQRFKFQTGNDWQLVEFDISKVQGIDLSSINNVLFFADPGKYMTAGEFWLDDIYLIKKEAVSSTAPNMPQIEGVNLVKDDYRIKWSDERNSGASLYEVQVSKQPDFKNPTSFFTNNDYLKLGELALEESYFRVRAWNYLPEYGGKASSFSEVYKYQPVQNPPPIIDTVWSQAGDDTDGNYSIGALVRLAVKEKYNAKDIAEAKARITSDSTGYDSGWLNLSLSESKDYYFYHWDTSGLKPASDYKVEFSLKDEAGQLTKDDSLITTLSKGFGFLPSILYTTPEILNLSNFGGFKFTYDYQHLDEKSLGKYWIHSYAVYLKEYADSSIELIWKDGRVYSFVPSEDGYKGRGLANKFQFEKTATGYLVKDKDDKKYIFDKEGELINVIDQNGNATILVYEENLLKKVINQFGQEIRFEYSKNKIKKIIDPYGREINLSYNEDGRFKMIEDYNGKVIKFDYYPDGRIKKVIEERSGGFKERNFEYNEQGLIRKIYDKEFSGITDINRVIYEYYPEEAKIVVKDANNKPTTYIYNELGLPIYREDPIGGITRWSYDQRGNLIKVINQRSFESNFGYDDRNNLTKIIDSLGNEIQIEYHPEYNLPVRITDANGNTTKYMYDGKGNLIKVIDTLGNETNLSYDSRNQLIGIIDPLGNKIKFNYDEDGQFKLLIDQNGNEVKFEYENGDLSKIIEPLGNVTRYLYEFPKRYITSVIDVLGNQTKYEDNQAGNLIKLIDPLGRERQYLYDGLDRLTGVIYPDGSKIEYEGDKRSNLVSIKDQNGNTIQYKYDSLSRITAKIYPDGIRIEFKYDEIGNIAEVNDLNGIYKYEYDSLNRLTKEILPDESQIKYEYNANGNLIKLVYPDGKILSYEYDVLNRVTKIIDESSNEVYQFQYDVLGEKAKLIYPNGITASYKYDQGDKLIKLEYKNSKGEILKSYNYTYDINGNRVQIETNEGDYQFNYDELNQLKEAQLLDKKLGYKYDALGNRINISEDGKETNYQINGLNQIIKAGSIEYKYDKNGNLVKKDDAGKITKYIYDYDNRLVKIIHPDTSETTYKYDYLGRRIEKNNKGQITRYIYNDWQVIAETDEQGNVLRRYIYGLNLDESLMVEYQGKEYYYLQDAMNNVVGLTDSQGNLAEEYSYTPFGKTVGSQSSYINPYLFVGRRYDEESGLYYFRNRYYEPSLGRFINPEPKPHVFMTNLYTYVGNNPVNLKDPTGLCGDNPGPLPPPDPQSLAIDIFMYQTNVSKSFKIYEASWGSYNLSLNLPYIPGYFYNNFEDPLGIWIIILIHLSIEMIDWAVFAHKAK